MTHQIDLEELLSGITPQNTHEEIDFGIEVGQEAAEREEEDPQRLEEVSRK